jgi:hypothetical protein
MVGLLELQSLVRLSCSTAANCWVPLSIRNYETPWSNFARLGACSYFRDYLFVLSLLSSSPLQRLPILGILVIS